MANPQRTPMIASAGLIGVGIALSFINPAAGGFFAKIGAAVALSTLAQSLNQRKQNGGSENLLGLPISNTDPGAPTVWAIGRRVRVPAQVLWMTRRARDIAVSAKGKSGGSYRQVKCDIALRLNDRLTSRLVQIIAQDQLLTWRDRNVYTVRTSEMTAAYAAGQVTFAMGSTEDPDFALTFEVGDFIDCIDWVRAVGTPDLNQGFYEVVAVTGHTSTPSSMVVEERSGQSMVGLNSTAGTPSAPATIARVDDAVFSGAWTLTAQGSITRINGTPINNDFGDVFYYGATVRYTVGGVVYPGVVSNFSVPSAYIHIAFSGTAPTSTGTAGQPARLALADSGVATTYFPSGIDYANHFHAGTDTQTEDSIIVATEGATSVGGFRGIAYQAIEDFNITDFGGVIPPMIEVLIDIDPSMTWADAIREVAKRGGLRDDQIDVTDVTRKPFEGYYLRGPVSGAEALHPLLMAAQVAAQDRNGTVAFFDIDNADVVAIQNGALFTDLAAGIDQPGEKKFEFGSLDALDYPTHLGIRYQDPDYGYGPGYQQFGVRNPSRGTEQNVDDLDMSNLVLTPKDARNIAATIVRRAHVNGTTLTVQLPASYLHVLENDLLTVTDDAGEDHTIRVTQVDVGTNFIVLVTGAVERVNLTVSGSPVQGTAGTAPNTGAQPSDVLGVVFDAPGPMDTYAQTPGVFAVACGRAGTTWAGCTVYASTDSGNNWAVVGTIGAEHAIGTLDAEFPGGVACEAFGTSAISVDEAETVTIEFNSTGPLPFASATTQNVIDGWQWFAMINDAGQVVDVFGARDVTANTATNYTFGYLLRGLRGTWQTCQETQPIGTRVVALGNTFDLSGLFVDLPGLSYPTTVALKFVPPGVSVSAVEAVGIGTQWRNVQPFPVRDVTKAYQSATGAVRFVVDHWTRTNLAVGQVGPYMLDETNEAYTVTLYHQSGNGQAVVVRSVTAAGTGSPTLRDPWVEFTSAEQTSAGYTPGPSETYWVGVVQNGDYADSQEVVQEL